MTSGDFRRAKHADLSLQQVADRLAIRELVDAYAYCADRRDSGGQMALFTEDSDFQVYMDVDNPTATQHLKGRAALAPVFDELNAYDALSDVPRESTAAETEQSQRTFNMIYQSN
jgi:hypothetical protein